METSLIIIIVILIVLLLLIALFCRQSDRPKPTDLYYFLPDEVVFKIRHSPTAFPPNADGLKADIVAAIQGFLASDDQSPQRASMNVTQPADSRWRDRLEMPEAATANIVTLPFTNESGLAFSLVRVPVKEYDEKEKDQTVRSILRDAYAELKQNNLIPLANGYTIEDFSFNWLISNLHHGGATGGPGGRPSSASVPTSDEQDFRMVSPTTNLMNSINIPQQNTVYVAILDTAPTIAAISDALHKWVDTPQVPHPLVKELFDTKNTTEKLTIHRASLSTIQSMEHFSPALHTYEMPDHGTFIAGIIHSGAPAATLHLYEVLSRYGVGTFTSIAQGIEDAMGQLGRPLIINCSFQFCLPDGSFGAQLEADLGIPLDNMTQSMKDLFEKGIAEDANIIVVASAGNDSPNSEINPNSPYRVPARYPAAFSNVISVGALPKGNPRINNRYTPAHYSNYAGAPSENGFMAFGGEEGTGQGVRGVYISGFPNWLFPNISLPNSTGWAWWAGTSFAAAIITGLLAADLSSNSGFLPANSTDPTPVGPFETAQGEAVILVNQG